MVYYVEYYAYLPKTKIDFFNFKFRSDPDCFYFGSMEKNVRSSSLLVPPFFNSFPLLISPPKSSIFPPQRPGNFLISFTNSKKNVLKDFPN